MVSIKDLASLTGYSVATISRVINNSPKVSENTRLQVEEAIKATGYHPNFIGRSLRLASSKKLLLLLPTVENTFYGDILRGIEQTASAAGYQVVIGVTQNEADIEQKYVDMLTSRQVDGMIIANCNMDKHDLNRLSESFPIVLLAHVIDGANVSSVAIDNVTAAYEATKYLIDLGHKTIGMLSGQYYRNPSMEREEGFKAALREAGLEVNPAHIIRADFDFRSGLHACKRLLSYKIRPTAIFCVADSIAIGAERYLMDAGLEKDISVVGFDNVVESEFFFNGITTVNQPKFDLGRISVDLLLKRICDEAAPAESIILPHTLIERSSVFSVK